MKKFRFIYVFLLLVLSGFVNAGTITIKTTADFNLTKGRVCLLDTLTQDSVCFGTNEYFSVPINIKTGFSIDTPILGSFVITAPSGLYIPYIVVSHPDFDGYRYFYDSGYTLADARKYLLLDRPVKSSITSAVPDSNYAYVSSLCSTGSLGTYTTYSVFGSGFGSSRNRLFQSFGGSSSGIISWSDTRIDFKAKSIVFPFAVLSKTFGRSNFVTSAADSCS